MYQPTENQQKYMIQGMKAHKDGFSRYDCPHPYNSDQRVFWMIGWNKANKVWLAKNEHLFQN